MTKIRGIEGVSPSEIEFELGRGGRFVFFPYCISLLVVTMKRASDVYFVRSGESAIAKGLPYLLVSLVAGWWGIPWGPIYTVQCVYTNLRGGEPAPPGVLKAIVPGGNWEGVGTEVKGN